MNSDDKESKTIAEEAPLGPEIADSRSPTSDIDTEVDTATPEIMKQVPRIAGVGISSATIDRDVQKPLSRERFFTNNGSLSDSDIEGSSRYSTNGYPPPKKVATIQTEGSPSKKGCCHRRHRQGTGTDEVAEKAIDFKLIYGDLSNKDKRVLYCSIVAAVIKGTIPCASFLVMGKFVEHLMAKGTSAGGLEGFSTTGGITAATCMLAMMALAVMAFIAEFVAAYGFENAALHGSIDRKSRFVRALIRQEASFFDANDPLGFSSGLYVSSRQIREGSGMRISQCIAAISCVLCSYTVAFIIEWRLTLALIAIMPIVVVSASCAFNKFAKHSKLSQDKYQDAGSLTEETFGAIKTVQAFDMGERLRKEYERLIAPCYKHDQKAIVSKACANLAITLCVGIIHALGWYLASVLLRDEMERGCHYVTDSACFSPTNALIVFVNILNGGNMFQEITPNIGSLLLTTQACRKLDKIIHREPKISGYNYGDWVNSYPMDGNDNVHDDHDCYQCDTAIRKAIRSKRRSFSKNQTNMESINAFETLKSREDPLGDVEFKGIEFVYPTRPEMTILKDFNIKFETGKAYALVGPSGCGKSTIVQMILRFYDPIHGTITFSGEDFRHMNVADVRERVALVQQEPRLFATSIYENVAMGICDRETLSPAEEYIKVHRCLQMAQAWDLVSNLEGQVFYNVGRGGQLLSGGQRQRIAIARALARDPELLILDEATSALDNKCEQRVQQAIDQIIANGICTVVMIAHRLSTVRKCDKIFVLNRVGDHSDIVESGSHDELIAQNGIYMSLTVSQSLAVVKTENIRSSEDVLTDDDLSEPGHEGVEFDADGVAERDALDTLNAMALWRKSSRSVGGGSFVQGGSFVAPNNGNRTMRSSSSFHGGSFHGERDSFFGSKQNSYFSRRKPTMNDHNQILHLDDNHGDLVSKLHRIEEGKELALPRKRQRKARENKLEKADRKRRERDIDLTGEIRRVYKDSWRYSTRNKFYWVLGLVSSLGCAIFFPMLPLLYGPAMQGMIDGTPPSDCFTLSEWEEWCLTECAVTACHIQFFREFCLDQFLTTISPSPRNSRYIVSPMDRESNINSYTQPYFNMELYEYWAPGSCCSFSSISLIENGTLWGAIYTTMALAGALVFFGRDFFMNNLSEDSIHRKRTAGFTRCLGHDSTFFEKTDCGAISEILSSDLTRIRGAVDNAWIFIQIGGISAFAIIVGFATNWQLSLIAGLQVIFGAPAGFLVAKNINSSVSVALLTGEGSDEAQTAGTVGFVINEIVTNLKLIQAYNHELTSMNYFWNASQPELYVEQKTVTVSSLFVAMSSCFVYLSASLTFFWADSMCTVQNGGNSGLSAGFDDFLRLAPELDAIKFITIYTVFVFWGMMVGRFSGLSTDTGKTRASINKYYRIVNYERKHDMESPYGIQLPDQSPPDIVVDHLSFNYPSKPRHPVYNKVTFTAPAGKTIALVGPSGTGKSTLIQLLERFYPLDGTTTTLGEIRLNNVNINDINIRSLRNSISLVDQMPVLFSSLTVGENISVGLGGNATEMAIVRAARQANADSFIRHLPDGYNTKVGLGGGLLSGGQKQRIALARALIRKPSILLLDEATSALDAESEAVVRSALAKSRDEGTYRPTTIVVAHRLASIKDSDLIVVLKNDGHGSYTVEEGTHEELMERAEFYRMMVDAVTS